MEKYVIGLDYGTDSCRAVIVNADNGAEVASSVKYYPRWKAGKYCNPQANQYRQHPLDYVETLEAAVKDALAAVAAGVYEKVEDAQKAMGLGFASVYHPDETAHRQYMELYKKYVEIGKLIV